jgi:hypothetical protein
MYKHFEGCKKVLISGCGGGYDVFCGLDLLLNLYRRGYSVILGSYSFTDNKILTQYGEKIHDYCYKVTYETPFNEHEYYTNLKQNIKPPPKWFLEQMGTTLDDYISTQINGNSPLEKIYFPEYKLVKYLHDEYNMDISIYCFVDGVVGTLIEAYKSLVAIEKIDCIVLADGGTDSLMTGVEDGLGTPYEDICHIVAVNSLKIDKTFLYCLGYNADRHHGVTDESYLANTSQLIKADGFLGSYMLNKNDETTHKYIATFMNCDPENSIVNTSVVAAINGEYGDVRPPWLQYRMGDCTLNISPFLSLYWIYKLDIVHQKLKYNIQKLILAKDPIEIVHLLRLSI